MSRVKHREDVFYDLLDEFGAKVLEAAELYESIIVNYSPTESHVLEFRDIEHACDASVRQIMIELAQSFITPFDREDIADLSHTMDDIVDAMYGVVQRLWIFNVKKPTEGARRIAKVTVDSVRELKVLLDYLPNFKKDKRVIEQSDKINKLENEGDDIYHEALGHLYDGSVEALEVIKWNKLYDTMESAVDSCEKCAYVVDGVVIKNA